MKKMRCFVIMFKTKADDALWDITFYPRSEYPSMNDIQFYAMCADSVRKYKETNDIVYHNMVLLKN